MIKRILFTYLILAMLPFLGIFMQDKNGNDFWYKYPYIIGTYSIASIYIVYYYKKYYDKFF